jgi:hypothetical protein
VPRLRFRIRTIMFVVAAAAVMMGLLRLFPTEFPLFFGQIAPFALYSWFLRTRSRRYSNSQTPIPESRTASEREARESVA